MKNIVGSLLTSITVSILLILGNNAIAQTGTPNSTFPPNLKKYFTDKYSKIERITSTLIYQPHTGHKDHLVSWGV